MQNRFGLKDFVLLVLLIAVGISIWLSMFQEDRRWENVREVQQQIQRVEQQLSILAQRLEEGVVMHAPGAGGEAARDDSWARPGYDINWQSPFRVVNDPRGQERFATGGTFTEIFEAQPPQITPYVYSDVYGRRINDQVVDTLGRFHPAELHFEGVLAEAWQYDPAGMWMRVKLRPNARFSDGKPVTAKDVKFSFEFFMNPEIESPRWRGNYAMFDRVEVVDELVAEFHFKEPNFINKERVLTMYIIPEHFYSEFTASQINESTGLLMGSGPFRLRTLDPDNQWRPGREDVVLVRNEQYWGPRPALDSIRYRVIRQDLAALTAYNNREADMMRPSSRQFISYNTREDWLERNEAMLWYNIRGGYSFIVWNHGENSGTQTPFHDARVRRAMTHLIDREWIIEHIMEGIGEVATGPFNPRTDQANPNIKPLEHNVDKARQLLNEAGWRPDRDGDLRNERGDRFTFEYTISTGSEATLQLAQYVCDQCARVGIRCDINRVDWAIFADILQNRRFDAITFMWSPSNPEGDPYQLWHSDNIADRGDNVAQWSNERADWLIENGRRELDREKRMQMWHELHQVIHEEQPYTFLVNRPWLRFLNRRMHNVHPYLDGLQPREYFIPVDLQASPM